MPVLLNWIPHQKVPDVISSIRQVSKAALKEDAKPSKDSEDAFYDSQKFEVLYCGKVTVAHKKAPSTLIDDCIEKFSLHERQRLKLLNEQRNNESSLDLPLCEGNLPASPSDSPFEELDSPDNAAGHAAMFTVGSQTNLTNLASTRGSFPERILEDSGFDEQQEFRSRCSSVTAVMQRRVHDTNLKIQPRRRHASAPSHVQPSDSEKNRTMLFQVGRFEVNLISPDTKSVVLEKNFKDISSCSQGIKHVDHFGFICRESVEPGLSQYVCYVFQCASESLVDEVMLTLKQAFSTAAALQNAKTQIKLCEACPMHSLHKLCERIEGLYPPRAKLVIQRHLSSLTDNEQADIFERVQKMKPDNDQEENELVILHLRQLCETKQKTHIHIGEAPSAVSNSAIPESTTSGGRFKLDILKNKAKKSLTSSLENIFSRGANRMRGRLGSVDSFERCNSLASDKDASPGDSPPATPPASPVSSAWQPFPEEDSDSPQFRRRAHTFSHPPSSARRRITFQNGRSQSVRSPLLRQSCVETTSPIVGVRRTLSESESASPGLPSSVSAPSFLKSFYQGSGRLLQHSESDLSKRHNYKTPDGKFLQFRAFHQNKLIRKWNKPIAQRKCLYTNAHSMGSKQEELEDAVLLESYDLVAIAETRPPDQWEPMDEVFLLQLQEASHSQALFLLGDFNHPDIYWKSSTASCRQSRRLLECIGDNFLSQVMDSPTRGDAIRDLMVTNTSALIGDVKIGGSLGCSGHTGRVHRPEGYGSGED
ncbi:PREDICTED: TBC1 domain family member 4-like [Leptosomus discolor]|nr:PREDICTED: TBC1 domain family member 4-like [Leptosomus discolor]